MLQGLLSRPRNADDVIKDYDDGRMPAQWSDDFRLLVERIEELENQLWEANEALSEA